MRAGCEEGIAIAAISPQSPHPLPLSQRERGDFSTTLSTYFANSTKYSAIVTPNLPLACGVKAAIDGFSGLGIDTPAAATSRTFDETPTNVRARSSPCPGRRTPAACRPRPVGPWPCRSGFASQNRIRPAACRRGSPRSIAAGPRSPIASGCVAVLRGIRICGEAKFEVGTAVRERDVPMLPAGRPSFQCPAKRGVPLAVRRLGLYREDHSEPEEVFLAVETDVRAQIQARLGGRAGLRDDSVCFSQGMNRGIEADLRTASATGLASSASLKMFPSGIRTTRIELTRTFAFWGKLMRRLASAPFQLGATQ